MIQFIEASGVPTGQKVTYASIVCDNRTLKIEPWRVRLVIGGGKLTYSEDTESQASNMVETKILLNSAISDAGKGAKFFIADIKYSFLVSPITKPEYTKVSMKFFPDGIIKQYNLQA